MQHLLFLAELRFWSNCARYYGLKLVDEINIEAVIAHESELKAIRSLICALEIRMSGAYSSIQFMKLLRCKQGS